MKNYKPKKSLGQHFLQDEKALEKIVKAADLKVEDRVLEIGPGKGALTRELINACMDVRTYVRTSKVIAIEKDENLANELARNFQFSIFNLQSISNDAILKFKNNAAVIEGDILEINLPKLIEKNDFFGYKVVANIPYYITGKIIRLLFETKHQPKLIVLLVQKEVAERICAGAGKMSILAVAVQYHGTPEIVDYVPKESFEPVPKVDSAILKIVPHDRFNDSQKDTRDFFTIVKIGFSSPRKTLVNNLAAGLDVNKNQVLDVLKKNRLSENARAQELGVEDWKMLQNNIFSINK